MNHFSVTYRDGEHFRSLSNTLTLEQRRFELLVFIYTLIFFFLLRLVKSADAEGPRIQRADAK